MSSCCHCTQEEPCAKRIAIFSHLDRESLMRISALACHRSYKKGKLLFSPQQASGLYLIAQGRVKVYEISASGQEALLRVLNKGDFVGEEALFSGQETYTFGEALSAVEACFIRREDFLQMLLDYPSISLKLLEEYSRRLISTGHQASANQGEKVMQRLALYLLELASAEDSESFTLPLQMRELSRFLGTTPETLSRRIQKLKKDGLIEKKGRQITLRDRPALLLLADTNQS